MHLNGVVFVVRLHVIYSAADCFKAFPANQTWIGAFTGVYSEKNGKHCINLANSNLP